MKHAYLIMAHCRPDLLQLLIEALDDDRNDIYIHIDLKSENLTWNLSASKSSVYRIPGINVIWGEYSQIECEYRLFEAAHNNGPYSYYHMMTGVSYPLKNQNYIHQFFDEHYGFEFIGFDNKKDYSFRMKYKHLMPKYGKRNGKIGQIMYKLESVYFSIQKVCGRDLLSQYDWICKKGLAYCSVTDDFVTYILEKEGLIRSLLKYSISGDEVFIQTLAYNSKFRDRIYNYNDEFVGCLRLTTWLREETQANRCEHSFQLEDLDYILRSDKLYALKFDGKDGISLVNSIREANHI